MELRKAQNKILQYPPPQINFEGLNGDLLLRLFLNGADVEALKASIKISAKLL
ncbi:hypothetical protein [Mucilaginibacter gracilis]|uniref:hypothetical protein n=1 Tax=Mucilaginibacter gracilis TaxID=423350 RepID=UPI0013C3616B|nr:hypothetical protein [Mucilaginibacter gracilis]